jgi:succinyl-CoA synthetase beta subunit
MLPALYRAYVSADADLVEINPLVLTAAGDLVALDAKVTLDDSAAFRHPEWQAWRDTEVLDPRERRAREKGLNYVGLDGTVGIIGNGAGLVMSTLDVVSHVGGSAANFLDVGGGASAAVIAAALEVVSSDERVGAILVNIFGGITRGDEVAKGIIQAVSEVDIPSPIVVRLDGTNAEEGRALLADHLSDRLRSEPTMLDAARLAVELAAGGGR